MLYEPSITKKITYRHILSEYSELTMKISETKTDISTRAFVSEIEDIEIQGSTGIIAAAKRRFLVRADALANIRPTTRDRIYEDGRWREIIRIDKTSIGPMPVTYVFYAR